MTKVLVIDDEPRLLRALRVNLKARGYEVATAGTGGDGLAHAARWQPDMVVLELALPDMDGLQVIVGLRAWTAVPVIVLSGRVGASDMVDALDAGADDFVAKPFSMEELLARLRVAERHRNAPAIGVSPATSRLGRHTIDFAARTVVADDGTAVHLTGTQWRILEVLMREPGQLVLTQDLIRRVWSPGSPRDARPLRFHIAGLRRRLESEPADPAHLFTEKGLGYRYRP
jgi:two-component system KDP operon response regulator KdpE